MGYGLRWQGHFLSRQTERPRLHLRKAGNMSITAMKQALEALENLQGLCSEESGFIEQVTIWTPEAIDDLRQAIEQACTCPSGDGSLRWPCLVHPPTAPAQGLFTDMIQQHEGLAEELAAPAQPEGTNSNGTPASAQPLTCTWTPEDDDNMPGTWASSCGELWSFIDGGPDENRVSYCHHCGGKVIKGASL